MEEKECKECKLSFKKGDILILKEGKNSNKSWEGIPLEVVCDYTKSNDYYKVKALYGSKVGSINLYTRCPTDIFCLYERKKQAKFLREQIKHIKKNIVCLERDAKRLEQFESDEEEVADKLQKLMKAKGTKAMVEILKELKRTNYL